MIALDCGWLLIRTTEAGVQHSLNAAAACTRSPRRSTPSSPQVSDKASRFDPRNEPRVLGCSLYAPPHAHAHAHAPHAHGALTTALAQPSPSLTSPAALTTALGDACEDSGRRGERAHARTDGCAVHWSVDACGDSGRRGERAHARSDGCAVHWSVDAEGQAMDVVHALLLGEDARVCVWLARVLGDDHQRCTQRCMQ